MSTKKVLIGTAIVLGAFAIYNARQKRRPPQIYYRKKMAGNYNARTIPPFGVYILESQRDNLELLNHELVHWKQYQEKGLINFYLDYNRELNQYGYDQMPMEIEARANETDFCKKNYTYCVRNGIAKTVYNPEFRL